MKILWRNSWTKILEANCGATPEIISGRIPEKLFEISLKEFPKLFHEKLLEELWEKLRGKILGRIFGGIPVKLVRKITEAISCGDFENTSEDISKGQLY